MQVFDEAIWSSVGLARKLRSLDFKGSAMDFQKSRQLTKLTELRTLFLDSFSMISRADTFNMTALFKSLRKLECVSLTNDRCADVCSLSLRAPDSCRIAPVTTVVSSSCSTIKCC